MRTSRRWPRRPLAPVGLVLGVVGSVGVLIATALPWVQSGQVGRNLYQLTGVAHHLGLTSVMPLGALAAVPLAAAVPIVVGTFGWARTTVACAVVVGFGAVALGVAALALGSGRTGIVTLAPEGPCATTIAGAFLLVGAGATVRSWRRRTRRLARPTVAL